MLEICQNAVRAMELATDHHHHDGPSQIPSSHTCAISSAALFITHEKRYDGLSQAQRSVKGLRSKTVELLEFGYLDYFTDLRDEPAEWTFMATTVRHALRNPTLGQNSSSSFSSCSIMPPTDRHEHDELLQASQVVLFCISWSKTSAFIFQTNFLQIKRNLHKNQYKKDFGHTKLQEKALKVP